MGGRKARGEAPLLKWTSLDPRRWELGSGLACAPSGETSMKARTYMNVPLRIVCVVACMASGFAISVADWENWSYGSVGVVWYFCALLGFPQVTAQLYIRQNSQHGWCKDVWEHIQEKVGNQASAQLLAQKEKDNIGKMLKQEPLSTALNSPKPHVALSAFFFRKTIAHITGANPVKVEEIHKTIEEYDKERGNEAAERKKEQQKNQVAEIEGSEELDGDFLYNILDGLDGPSAAQQAASSSSSGGNDRGGAGGRQRASQRGSNRASRASSAGTQQMNGASSSSAKATAGKKTTGGASSSTRPPPSSASTLRRTGVGINANDIRDNTMSPVRLNMDQADDQVPKRRRSSNVSADGLPEHLPGGGTIRTPPVSPPMPELPEDYDESLDYGDDCFASEDDQSGGHDELYDGEEESDFEPSSVDPKDEE